MKITKSADVIRQEKEQAFTNLLQKIAGQYGLEVGDCNALFEGQKYHKRWIGKTPLRRREYGCFYSNGTGKLYGTNTPNLIKGFLKALEKALGQELDLTIVNADVRYEFFITHYDFT